jgi:hypothetical protein
MKQNRVDGAEYGSASADSKGTAGGATIFGL